jgi:hypothetical protein
LSGAFCWGAATLIILFYVLFVCLVEIGCVLREWSLGKFGLFMHVLLHVPFPRYAVKSSSFWQSHLHNDEMATGLKVVRNIKIMRGCTSGSEGETTSEF